MQQHEKTSLRYVFFRLYSNDELLDFLKEQLKNGLVLDHCKGFHASSLGSRMTTR